MLVVLLQRFALGGNSARTRAATTYPHACLAVGGTAFEGGGLKPDARSTGQLRSGQYTIIARLNLEGF